MEYNKINGFCDLIDKISLQLENIFNSYEDHFKDKVFSNIDYKLLYNFDAVEKRKRDHQDDIKLAVLGPNADLLSPTFNGDINLRQKRKHDDDVIVGA